MTSHAPQGRGGCEYPVSPIDRVSIVELEVAHAALLQALFEENADYFHAIQGAPAGPSEALEELTESVPDGWSFTRQYKLGWQDRSGDLRAMANITSDLLATGVWHIGLFMLQKARHGTGGARQALLSAAGDMALR